MQRSFRSFLLKLFAAAVVVAIPVEAGFAAEAQSDTNSQPSTRLILSHLPLKTSRAYHKLISSAGNPTRETLPMTKAEIWLVPASRAGALREKADEAGVTVTVIGDDNPEMLISMGSKPMSQKQHSMMDDAMHDRAAMGVSMMGSAAPETLEYALTRPPDPGGHTIVHFKLSDTMSVAADRINLIKEADSYVWQGEIVDTFEPVTLVFWPNGRLSGTILHQGLIYKIQPMGGAMHGVIETAPAMLPPEHAPMGAPMQQKLEMRDDPLMMKGDAGAMMDKMMKGESIEHQKDATPTREAAIKPPADITLAHQDAAQHGDEQITITVIVAYTRAAAKHYDDISRDLISLSVAQANQSFRRSGLGNIRLELAHVYETGYVEQGSHFDHMFRFAEKNDGFADEVHALRDKYRADIAIMIVDDANGCGLSAGIAPPAERAFAVVHHGCAASMYSLAHEVGHIIGARHDTGFDDTSTPVPYAHGYVSAAKWRTMMSYEQSCGGCPRLPIWSSPDILVHGEPAGNDMSNNARIIRDGARRVAGFR